MWRSVSSLTCCYYCRTHTQVHMSDVLADHVSGRVIIHVVVDAPTSCVVLHALGLNISAVGYSVGTEQQVAGERECVCEGRAAGGRCI